MGIKNIWTLNIDEALVVDEIKNRLGKKKYEVFLPTNAQLQNIDLILLDLTTISAKTIQVKGSRTYESTKSEIQRYGNGSTAWITIEKQKIFEPANEIDFFIFVLHGLIDKPPRKRIDINYLIFPFEDFKKLIQDKKVRRAKIGKGQYHFYIWINSEERKVFDYNEPNKLIDFSKFFNNWEILKG